ncbi:uncharacterized protein B0T15DRAFT_507303 [Chaetomium strumarium]|uniref:Uncharacterized protein n=1 Tax=Chaetomium strumarium TaxID=1170767 RepID=A0AAJ0H2M3_9PEZI|nr:hypothetical protein B0T15DRAFT_507303 [Chaetomium strumarium]
MGEWNQRQIGDRGLLLAAWPLLMRCESRLGIKKPFNALGCFKAGRQAKVLQFVVRGYLEGHRRQVLARQDSRQNGSGVEPRSRGYDETGQQGQEFESRSEVLRKLGNCSVIVDTTLSELGEGLSRNGTPARVPLTERTPAMRIGRPDGAVIWVHVMEDNRPQSGCLTGEAQQLKLPSHPPSTPSADAVMQPPSERSWHTPVRSRADLDVEPHLSPKRTTLLRKICAIRIHQLCKDNALLRINASFIEEILSQLKVERRRLNVGQNVLSGPIKKEQTAVNPMPWSESRICRPVLGRADVFVETFSDSYNFRRRYIRAQPRSRSPRALLLLAPYVGYPGVG